MIRSCSGRHLVLAAFLLSVALLGCRGSEDGRVRLKIWHPKATPERMLLDEVVERYNRDHPDVLVETLFKENEEMRNLFVTAAVGGQGPDLVYGPADNVGLFVLTGSILPLDDFLSDETFDQFEPEGTVVWRDTTWMLADQVGNHLTLVYNRALVSNPPETFDELIAMADELSMDTDGDGRNDRYVLAWNYTEPFFFIPFLTGYGGWVMDDEGNPTLDSKATVQAIQFILDLRDKYKVIPRESDYDVADALFKEGRAAMIINGPWSWGGYIDAGIDIGLTPIPKIAETGRWASPMVSAKGYAVNANVPPEKYEAVKDLLLYLTSAEVQVEMAKRLGTNPVNKLALADSSIQSNSLLQDSMRQIELGRQMPLHPALRQIWDGARGPYQLIMNGAVTAAEGAKMMQEQAEKLIKDTFL